MAKKNVQPVNKQKVQMQARKVNYQEYNPGDDKETAYEKFIKAKFEQGKDYGTVANYQKLTQPRTAYEKYVDAVKSAETKRAAGPVNTYNQADADAFKKSYYQAQQKRQQKNDENRAKSEELHRTHDISKLDAKSREALETIYKGRNGTYAENGKPVTYIDESSLGGKVAKAYYDATGLKYTGYNKKALKQQFMQDNNATEKDYDLYMQYLKEQHDAEDNAAAEEVAKRLAKETPAIGSVYDPAEFAMSGLAGTAAFAETVKHNFDADPYSNVNTNSKLYRAQNFNQAYKQQQMQDMANALGNDTAANIAYGAYTSIGEMIPAIYMGGAAGEAAGMLGATAKTANTIGKVASLPTFGTSAFSSTLKEAQDRGLSKDNAIATATVAGLAEMGTEIFSLDNIFDIMKGSGKAAARSKLVNIMASTFIEGSEEATNDVINEVADRIINKDQSVYETRLRELLDNGYSEDDAKRIARNMFLGEVFQDFAAGAISGGVMGGGAIAARSRLYGNIAKQVNEGDYQAVVENLPLNEEAYENKTGIVAANEAVDMAQEYMKKVEEGQEVTQKERKQLVERVNEALENRLIEQENTAEEPAETTDTQPAAEKTSRSQNDIMTDMSRSKNARELTAAYHEAVETIPAENRGTIDALFNLKANALNMTGYQMNAARMTDEEVYNAGYENKPIEYLTPQQAQTYNEAAMKRFEDEAKTTAEVSKKARNSEGKEFTIEGIKDVTKDNMTLLTSEGEVKLSDATFSNKGEQRLYNNAAQLDNAYLAQEYVDNYVPGMSVNAYDSKVKQAITAGKMGTSFDAVAQGPYAEKIGKDVLRAFYDNGKETDKQQSKNGKKTTAAVKKEGKVIDTRENKKSRVLNQGLLRQVADKFGVEIEITDSLAADKNGTFAPALGRIILNTNNPDMYKTMFHELSEFAQAYNEEGMDEVRVAVLEYALQKNPDALRSDLEAYQKAYAEVEGSKSISEASEELFNDCLSEIFRDEAGVKDFVDWVLDNHTKSKAEMIIDRIAKFINDIAEYINKNRRVNRTQATVMQMDTERAMEIREQLLQAFDEAIKNRDALVGQEGQAEARNSLEVDTEGRKLSADQKRFFAESKMVDAEGRLEVMYHGTAEPFYVFDNSYSDDKRSFFFTNRKDTANTYAIRSLKDGAIMAVYLNLKNPLIVDAEGAQWNHVKYESRDSYKIRPTWRSDYLFLSEKDAKALDDKYNISKLEDAYEKAKEEGQVEYNGEIYDEDEVEEMLDNARWQYDNGYDEYFYNHKRPITFKEFFDNYTDYSWKDLASVARAYDSNAPIAEEFKDDYESYEEAVESYKNFLDEEAEENNANFDGMIAYVLPVHDEVFEDGVWGSTRKIAKIAQESGHDGVIIRNIYDNAVRISIKSDIAIAFESNQIKSVENKQPTNDSDIRYSIDVQPERVFYTKAGTEVVQNPTSQEYAQMREDILNDRPWMRGTGEPLFRHTYDEQGNEYYWDAMGGLHAQVEPEINKKYNTRTNQQYQWWQDEDKDFWGGRYSLDVDTQDRKLTADQQDMFKNSKVVDDQGRLMVMFHGSPVRDLTVFKNALNFFTPDKAYAERYAKQDGADGEVYEVYLNIEKPFDVTDPECRRIFIDEYVKGGYSYSINPSLSDAEIEQRIEDGIDWTEADNLVEFIEEMEYDYDGLVLDEGGDQVLDENGNMQPVKRARSYVTFQSNQAKRTDNLNPTKDKDIRFSLEVPMEDSKSLIAIHNLSAEKMMKNLELGGFPMPSIAVTTLELGHDEYGDVSILFGKDTIDPSKNKKNKIYGGDAWTPTVPRLESKINAKVAEKVRQRINSLVPNDEQRNLGYVGLDNENLEDEINNRRGDIIDAYKDKRVLKYAFLKEKGIELDVPQTEKRLSNKFTNEQMLAATKVIKDLKQAEDLRMNTRSYENHPEIVEGLRQALNEQFREKYAGTIKGTKLFEKDLYEELSYSDFDNITAGLYKYYRDGIQQEMDSTAAREAIDKKIESKEAEYEKWLSDLFEGIIEKQGLRNNKDVFTYSGNRRSWESLHDEYNLGNVVKLMEQQDEKGEAGFFSASKIQALATKNFKNLKEVREAKEQLRFETEEEHEARIEEQSHRFTEICQEIKDDRESNPFIAIGRASDAIADAVSKYHTVQGIDRELREWTGLNIQDDTAQKIVDLMKDIAKNPTGYFEAKPRRAVTFDEIASVVVPDVETELQQALDEKSIPYKTYKAGDKESRKAAVNSVAEMPDVRFSLDVELPDGRVVDNLSDVLSPTEYNRVKDMKDNGHYAFTAKNGDRVYRLDNKLVYTDRRKNNFGISEIIVSNVNDNEATTNILDWYTDVAKGVLTNEEARTITERVLGKEAISRYTNESFGEIYRYDRPTERGKSRSDAFHAAKQQYRANFSFEDTDVRSSLDIDSDFGLYDMDDLQGVFTDEETGEAIPVGNSIMKADSTMRNLARFLQAANEPLKGHKVNNQALENIAEDLKRKYSSGADTKVIVENLKTLFNYLQTEDEVNYDEVTRLLSEVSRPIIAEAGNVNSEMVAQYNNFVDYIKSQNISLSDAQKKVFDITPYGSWNNFRKAMFGTIKFTNDGQPIDTLWNDIAFMSGGFLDPETAEEDMGIALADALTEMKPQAESLYGQDEQEASIDLAGQIMEAYYQAEQEAIENEVKAGLLESGVAGATAKAMIDKARKDMRKEITEFRQSTKANYEAKLADAQQQIQTIMDANRALSYDVKNLEKQNKQLTEKMAQEVVKAKARTKTRELKTYIEAEETKKQKKEIDKIAVDLLNRAMNPTDKKYMPEGMRKPIAEFLTGIDFVSHKARLDSKNTAKWQMRMDDLRRYLADAQKQDVPDSLSMVIDPDLIDDIDQFVSRNGDVAKVSQLPSWDLKELHSILTRLRAAVNKSNEMFTNERFKNQEQFNQEAYKELSAQNSQKNIHNLAAKVRDFFNKDLEDPVTYFSLMGDTIKTLFDSGLRGFDVRARDIKSSVEFMKELQKNKEAFYKWSQSKHTFNLQEGTIELTDAQIMSLYKTMQREQAKGHILPSGFKASRVTVGGKTIVQNKPVRISPAEFNEIVSTLSLQQMEVADRMQEFMAKDCAEWGNDVSMKLYGYRKFTEKNYFPIKTDANSRDTNQQDASKNAGLWANKNMSASKELVHGANNAIIIGDIFDVFSDHVTAMATYHGMVLPQMDMMRWFNYRAIFQGQNETGEIKNTYSMKEEIERLYGPKGTEYFINLMLGINGMEPKARGSVATWFIGRYKKAAVTAKVRVAIQQPTAIVRALDEMNGKYISKALATTNPAKYAKIAQDKSMLAWWKSQGYYETYLGKSVKEMMVGKAPVAQFVDDAAGFGAQKMDDLTWGVLYHATEYEIEDTTDLKPGTKAFDDAVVKRFEDVVSKTQVVDTVLHRTDIMRNQNELTKLATSFMAEPLKTYNMCLRSVVRFMRNPRDKKWKRALIRTLFVYVLNNALLTAVTSAWDAWKDDDDKTTYGERYAARYVKEFKDNLNPLNMLPYIKDAVEIIEARINGEYYSNTDMATEGISKLAIFVEHLLKAAQGERISKTEWGLTLEGLQALQTLSGQPIYNIVNDINTIHNAITDNWDTKQSTSDYGDLHQAITKDKDVSEEVQELLEMGKDKGGIKSSITNKFKEEYQAAEGTEKQEMGEAITEALVQAGYTQEEAKNTLDKWDGAETTSDTESFEEYRSDYESVYESIDKGGNIQGEVQKMITSGKKPAGIKQALTRKYKDQLVQTRDANLRNALVKAYMAAGDTNEEANKRIQSWLE